MKKSTLNSHQLKIRFDDDNPLAMRMRNGEFSFLLEFDTPPLDRDLEKAAAMPIFLAKRLENVSSINALAVTDRLHTEDSHDPSAMAEIMGAKSGKPTVMNLSGKGSSDNRVRELTARANSEGIQTILPITGDRSDRHPENSALLHNPAHPEGYHDSVETIDHLRRHYPKTLTGAGVNPFKYNLSDQYLQYCKMLRKLATGAAFITTHAGWDMKKLQELKWFLQMREVEVPVIVRLPILSRQRIQQLHLGFHPGVPVSRAFCAVLQREAELSETQSMNAQMTRLSLQAAGCRLLGYSGVQITGIRDEQTLDLALKAINNPPPHVKTYQDWVEAWEAHHSGTQFAPANNAYYMFSNLMQPELLDYSPENSRFTEAGFPPPSRRDLLRRLAMKNLHREWIPKYLRNIIGLRFCRQCQSHRADSSAWFHLCPKACPKRLTLGACGSSFPDGTCEFGRDKCFHHRVLALAAREKMIQQLEEPVI